MRCLFLLLTFLIAPVTALAAGPVVVRVEGDVANVLSLTREDLAKLPRATVSLPDRTGVVRRYDGVLVADLLTAAEPAGGPRDLPGTRNRYAVTVVGADDFGAVFGIADTDAALSPQPLLLADTMDGQPLAPGTGPTRLVVPGDIKPERWIKQVTAIVVRWL